MFPVRTARLDEADGADKQNRLGMAVEERFPSYRAANSGWTPAWSLRGPSLPREKPCRAGRHKKEAAVLPQRPESREETPKEGICGRSYRTAAIYVCVAPKASEIFDFPDDLVKIVSLTSQMHKSHSIKCLKKRAF